MSSRIVFTECLSRFYTITGQLDRIRWLVVLNGTDCLTFEEIVKECITSIEYMEQEKCETFIEQTQLYMQLKHRLLEVKSNSLTKVEVDEFLNKLRTSNDGFKQTLIKKNGGAGFIME
jgi:hypothetical protein